MRPISIVPPALVAVVVAVAALVFSHGSGSSTASAGKSGAVVSGSEKIEIDNYMYSPASVTVKVGTVITFTNEESVEHTATSNAEGLFDTGTLAKGQSMHIKLNKVGTYSFHCSFHAFMHGTIKVVQ